MKCGEQIEVRDIQGATACRFIAQCGDRFMLVSRTWDWRNGYLLGDWQAVLRELVAMTVPAKLIEKQMNVQSNSGGRYASIPLTYPLSAKGLADVLGVPVEEVRMQLADLAVEAG